MKPLNELSTKQLKAMIMFGKIKDKEFLKRLRVEYNSRVRFFSY